jgi:hypothetical protein
MVGIRRPLAAGSLLGGLATYFFDRQNGKHRRRIVVDRTFGTARRTGRRARRAGRGVRARVYGVKQKMLHLRERPKDLDDVTLARKVETKLFRPADVPKGKINVNVVDGVVELRGEADRPEMIEDLVRRARRIQGVRGVENRLHTP